MIQCFAKQSFTKQTKSFCIANLKLRLDKETRFLKFLTSLDHRNKKLLKYFEPAILGLFNLYKIKY